MPTHSFHQLDVFSAAPLKGNPLAVVSNAGATIWIGGDVVIRISGTLTL